MVKKKKKFNLYKLISIIIILLVIIMLVVPRGSDTKNIKPTQQMITQKLLSNSNQQLNSFKSKLVGTPKIVYITKDNYKELSTKYSFAFLKSIEKDYGYQVAAVGDYIVLYPDLVVVYNYNSDVVKSLFQIKTIGN